MIDEEYPQVPQQLCSQRVFSGGIERREIDREDLHCSNSIINFCSATPNYLRLMPVF